MRHRVLSQRFFTQKMRINGQRCTEPFYQQLNLNTRVQLCRRMETDQIYLVLAGFADKRIEIAYESAHD